MAKSVLQWAFTTVRGGDGDGRSRGIVRAGRRAMRASFPFVADAGDVRSATDLLAHYGVAATREAATRADRARDLGNHVHFCRWRQVGRLIGWLEGDPVGGTLH